MLVKIVTLTIVIVARIQHFLAFSHSEWSGNRQESLPLID